MNYFSGNIRLLRIKRALSQAEMLDKLGFPRSTWSGYENGVSQPDIDGIMRIASFFGVSVTDLLGRDLRNSEFLLHEGAEAYGEKSALHDSDAAYRRHSSGPEDLMKEIINAKQQIIESQTQTIQALEALVKRLNADLMRLTGKKGEPG